MPRQPVLYTHGDDRHAVFLTYDLAACRLYESRSAAATRDAACSSAPWMRPCHQYKESKRVSCNERVTSFLCELHSVLLVLPERPLCFARRLYAPRTELTRL